MIRIDTNACGSSGACAVVCPEDVIEFTGDKPVIVDARACTDCWICVENCSSGAIELD